MTTQTPIKEGIYDFLTQEKKPSKDFNKVGFFNDKKYDPDVSYFMVDWHSTNECRWVRSTYVPLSDLKEGLNHVESDVDSFRVLSEDFLSLPRDHWSDECDCYVPDIWSNRVITFDERYEEIAHFITGKPSLCKGKEEDLETWFNRIKSDPRTECKRWSELLEVKDGKFVRKEEN